MLSANTSAAVSWRSFGSSVVTTSTTATAIVLGLLLTWWWNLRRRIQLSGGDGPIVSVVVVGDIGRSPRMQNHADAFRHFLRNRSEGRAKSNTIAARKGTLAAYVCRCRRRRSLTPLCIVGYCDSALRPEISEDPLVCVVPLRRFFVDKLRWILVRCIPIIGFALFAALKVVEVSLSILLAAITIRKSEIIVIQNPPAFPAIIALRLLCRGSIIVDWHNYGFTLLGGSASASTKRLPLLNRLAEFAEMGAMWFADYHICVSESMRSDLRQRGFKSVSVLYDRPVRDHFQPLTLLERHLVFTKYFNPEPTHAGEDTGQGNTTSLRFCRLIDRGCKQRSGVTPNVYTRRPPEIPAADLVNKLRTMRIQTSSSNGSNPDGAVSIQPTPKQLLGMLVGEDNFVATEFSVATYSPDSETLTVRLRAERSALLVTSTSWTPDEDLDLLLESLALYDSKRLDTMKLPLKQDASGNGSTLPHLTVLVTGRGPMKDEWMAKAAAKCLKGVEIISTFAPIVDYPLLIGSADIGLCLHSSSSGLDLPMKFVDMQGAGLPILAYGYPALDEFVKETKSACTFRTADDLVERLTGLFNGFPGETPQLAFDKLSARSRTIPSWEEEWNKVMVKIASEALESAALCHSR